MSGMGDYAELLMKQANRSLLKVVCVSDESGFMEEFSRLLCKYGMPLDNVIPFYAEFSMWMKDHQKGMNDNEASNGSV